jgi:DNA primase small subunit
MNTPTKIFLRRKFQEYYRKNRISSPREISRREFGIGTLEQKIKIRHKSFLTHEELQNYLRREAPFFISYSTAYYEFPSNEPMSSKVWLGADLIFDLDVEMNLFEREKLNKVKEETINLLDFLLHDFGFSKKEIAVNFSGNHGYHVHVFSEKVKNLGGDERREILGYVSGEVNFKDFLRIVEGNKIFGPNEKSRGWAGRIYHDLYNFIKSMNVEQLKKIKGIGEKKAKLIFKERENILRALDSGRYDQIHPDVMKIDKTTIATSDPNVKHIIIKSVHSPLIQKIIEEKAIKMKAARDTDKMVTIDTSRLIRLPDSLHGGSGFIAKSVENLENLENFDPLKHALAFSPTKNIKILLKTKVPKFDFFRETVGPFKEDEKVKVPEALGIYLLLKGFGDALEG